VSFVVASIVALTLTAHAQNGKAIAALADDPACQTSKIAAAGGPMPKGQNTVVLRYLGVSNYELSYRDQVLLFDTFYSRVWPARPLGVTSADFTRATAILFGHGHWDHIADAPEGGETDEREDVRWAADDRVAEDAGGIRPRS
jgi:glyoxylase-like metal-dependent hydrolase (beta-lactamase superfamily II)